MKTKREYSKCKCGKQKYKTHAWCGACRTRKNRSPATFDQSASERRLKCLAESIAEFESDIKIKPRPFINALLTKDGTRMIPTYTKRGYMRHSKGNWRKNFEFVKV